MSPAPDLVGRILQDHAEPAELGPFSDCIDDPVKPTNSEDPKIRYIDADGWNKYKKENPDIFRIDEN